MTATRRLSAHIPDSLSGKRLDLALAELFPDYSRARLQEWLRTGQIRVDALICRPRDKVRGGELVEVDAVAEVQERWEAQEMALTLVYEDDSLLIINKPAGLIVHPGAGNSDGTLLNALLHYAPELAGVPRAGIVHRLDKDTSGLLVVARTLSAQKSLVDQLQARSFEREYDAVVTGVMVAGGTIDTAMGRHPVERTRMAVISALRGKQAITHYRVANRFRAHTHVRVRLETGRTHQIRVHMAHIHFPIVGDPVYGGRLRLPPHAGVAITDTLRSFKRQALHAAVLGLVHPESGQTMRWKVPVPDDMANLLAALHDDMHEQDED